MASIGVIDSISLGLTVVRRHPLMMVLPVAVDLLLWLAPPLSVEPLATRIAGVVTQTAASTGNAESVQGVADLLQGWGKASNLLSLLAGVVVGIPSLLAGGMPDGFWRPFASVQISSASIAFVLCVVLAAGGLAIAAVYLTGMGLAVQGQTLALSEVARKAWRNAGRLLALMAGIVVVVLLVGIPVSLVVALVMLLSPTVAGMIASLVGLMAFWATIWAFFYLFFLVEAMVLQEVDLRRSVLNSVAVVRSNFWSALGLIVLLNVLAAGFGVIWRWMAEAHPAGTVLAMIGNTFVGSGLAAASFVFYRGRYEALLSRVSA